jgi:hypothetical protein
MSATEIKLEWNCEDSDSDRVFLKLRRSIYLGNKFSKEILCPSSVQECFSLYLCTKTQSVILCQHKAIFLGVTVQSKEGLRLQQLTD